MELKIAQRINNNKRKFLIVNSSLGKHVPISPNVPLDMFNRLAGKVETIYKEERLLIIGMAETATALGAAVADRAVNAKYFMTTTREDLSGSPYLVFDEEHSHAVEQKLCLNGLEDCLPDVDRIVIIDDEVTTASTAINLITSIKKEFPTRDLKFGVVAAVSRLPNIPALERISGNYKIDAIYGPSLKIGERHNPSSITSIHNKWDQRKVTDTLSLRQSCSAFLSKALDNVSLPESGEIAIIGTEEFMYPPILLANEIRMRYPDLDVHFHATTRSPIEVSKDPEYPLHNRVELHSIYEKERQTFLYNIANYDKVLLITDTDKHNWEGIVEITSVFNTDTEVLIWGGDE